MLWRALLCTCTLRETACLPACAAAVPRLNLPFGDESLLQAVVPVEDGVRKGEHKTADTLHYILHLHYVHIRGENTLYVISYWSFNREKINIHCTNLGIYVFNIVQSLFFFYFLMSRPMSFRCLPPPFHFLYHPPFYVGHYPYSRASCQNSQHCADVRSCLRAAHEPCLVIARMRHFSSRCFQPIPKNEGILYFFFHSGVSFS